MKSYHNHTLNQEKKTTHHQNLLEGLELFYRLTPKEKQICAYLFDVAQGSFLNNNGLSLMINSKTIANKVGCAKRTVESFSKKMRSDLKHAGCILIDPTYRYKRKYINKFTFSKEFFFSMYMLKMKKVIYCSEGQKELLTLFSQDYGYINKLSTKYLANLRYGNAKTCGTVTTLVNYYRTEEYVHIPCAKKEIPKQEKLPPTTQKDRLDIPDDSILFQLKGIDLKVKEEKMLYYKNSGEMVKLAYDDYLFYTRVGNKIRNPIGFLMARAKAHADGNPYRQRRK